MVELYLHVPVQILTLVCGVAVVISVTKEGVKFSTRGDIGTANIVLRQNTTVDKVCPLDLSYYCIFFCQLSFIRTGLRPFSKLYNMNNLMVYLYLG